MSSISDLETKVNIPLPQYPVAFDALGNTIQTTVNNVGTDYIEGGSDWMQKHGAVRKTNGDIIPNNQFNQPAFPLEVGDTLIPKTNFLNTSGSRIRLFTAGQTDLAYAFFDKSNPLFWKQAVIDSLDYDSANTGDWHTDELLQAYLYDNVQDDYKYMLWSKEVKELFKDIFFYDIPLAEKNIDKALTYTKFTEVI